MNKSKSGRPSRYDDYGYPPLPEPFELYMHRERREMATRIGLPPEFIQYPSDFKEKEPADMSITDVYDYPYEDGDNQPRIVRIRVHQREEKKELEMKIVGAVKHHDPSGAVRYQDDPSIGSFKSMDRLSQEDLLAIGRAIEFYNSGNVPEE